MRFPFTTTALYFGDDDDPKGGDPKDGDPKPEPVQLSQERLDELLDKAYARGAKNSKDGQEAVAMRAELEELRVVKTEFDKLKAGKGDATGVTQEQLDEMKAQIKSEYEAKLEAMSKGKEEAEAAQADAVGTYRSKDLERQVVSAASKLGAKDADDVFALMDRAGTFEYDEESDAFVVKDDKGRVRLDVDNDMQPFSVDKRVAEFLDAKPHLKRSSGRTGTGGPGTGEVVGGESPELDASNLGAADVLKHGGRAVLESLRTGKAPGGG